MPALFILASFISLAAASPAFKNFVVQESRQSAPGAFAHLGPAAGDSMINLRIALPSQNVSGLDVDLLDVSDPKSANYGNHLSKDEVGEHLPRSDCPCRFYCPGMAYPKGVVGEICGAGNWISVAVNVSDANEMLAAEYQTFRHIASGKTYQRTLSYSLPIEVVNVVDTIHPTVVFDPPATGRPGFSAPRPRPRVTSPASCAITITPSCLQSLYNIPTTMASFGRIAVTGFINQWAQKADLTTFLQLFRPDMSSSTSFTLQTLDTVSNPQSVADASVKAGDGGVSGSQAHSCTTFLPPFPAGCPYITSVGSVTGIPPEVGPRFSSGVFSNYWGRPQYQGTLVEPFLNAQGSKNAGLFNVSGRGFPDVAAQGQNIEIATVEGTSASAPIFASIIALINSQRVAAGKTTFGFLNPLLYANPGMFNDVTSGSNPGYGTAGFSARAGWDAVTGLGTPVFLKFAAALV
ncbi:peptidase S8/S53 domain-containing protein [Roridomyces roridus]|uniref:Peptidase S8/S53 domain-containing protein n=1 Tax=Roridomyces roridus TaxID=1738132 RepID=A0AAD7C5S9_9AGAR|nr:peptidase S8/S53 domain-containing protein [Roridomyces roridus]